ncbi:MAG: hypothetical protein K8T20_03655 [Planctomycetes bacterium]|nr:hypothetical protein [Planctomycetota bacterium]
MSLSPLQKNYAFAQVIASATGHRLEQPGVSTLAVSKDGKRAILRWVKDAKETIELPRAQFRSAQELIVAIGDPTGILFEVFRIKRADLERLKKDGSRPALMTINLRDAAAALEMVMPLQVTGRQLQDAWTRLQS